MFGTAISTIRSVGFSVDCPKSLNDAPLTRLEVAPSGRQTSRVESDQIMEQAVLAQGLCSRCTLYPIALLISSFTFYACPRNDIWASNGSSRHSRQHYPYHDMCLSLAPAPHRRSMSTSPHDLGCTKIKKVIFRHLLSATEDTHRIGLQERTGNRESEIYGARKGAGYFSSVSESCARTAQQRYPSYQYFLHVTTLLTLPSLNDVL